jgi:hypothetical protein
VRRIEDPIANTTVEVDEYCTGSKIITVNGSRTAIVDYERQEVLEIDRAAATYSVARFDEIARVRESVAKASMAEVRDATQSRDAWKTTPLGVTQSRAGRIADAFEISATAPEKIKVEVSVDRQVTLSRKALDAITGSGYPNRASDQQEAIARACARASTGVRAMETAAVTESYGLPLDQSITIEADANTRVTVRNSIVRISSDLPPPEVLAIPAGAKLVESRAAQMQKSLKELEQANPAPRP